MVFPFFSPVLHLDCNCLNSVFVQSFHYSEYLTYFVMTLLGFFLLLGCVCQCSEGYWHFISIFHTDLCHLWLPRGVICDSVKYQSKKIFDQVRHGSVRWFLSHWHVTLILQLEILLSLWKNRKLEVLGEIKWWQVCNWRTEMYLVVRCSIYLRFIVSVVF